MRIRRWVLFLGLILFLASFLRLYKLNSLELFGDEIDVGYQAYSILKTGRDIRGYKFPLYFHSLAESRTPLYLYVTVPSIAIFGLNELGVRLPAVFFGLLNILLLAGLVWVLFKDISLSLLSALILAVLPWHIQYSRSAFEVTLLLTFVLLGSVCFLKSLSKGWCLPVSAFFFVLSLYVYSTAVLFVPLFTLLLILIFQLRPGKPKCKYLLFSVVVILIGVLPIIAGVLNNQSQERFSRISIFSDQKIIDRVIVKRGGEGGGGRIFHNKVTEIGKQFIVNYLTAFSPQFLFLTGDPNPRHSVGSTGEIYLVFLPFLFFGIFESLKNIKQKNHFFLLGWLAISPIPSSLTSDGGNHATRLFLMLPPLVVLIAKGLDSMFRMKSKFKIATVSFAFLFFIFNFVSYFHQYYVHYRNESWQFWHYGYKEILKELAKVENQYEVIILNNKHEPILERFLFWTKKDPEWFRNNFSDDKERNSVFGNLSGFKVNKYYFVKPKTGFDPASILDEKTLYLAFQGDEIPGDWDFEKKPPSYVKVIKLVKTPLGDPYIYLLSGKK